MKFASKCWLNDHWHKFNLKTGLYQNVLVFLQDHNLMTVIGKLEIDFSKIPEQLHGKTSRNLLEYLAKNESDYELVARFLYYFMNTYIDMRLMDYNDKRVRFIFSSGTSWKDMSFTIPDIGTISITVIPNPLTVQTSGTTQLRVINQNNVNVVPECTFSVSGESLVTVSSTGLVTIGESIGTTSIVVTHINFTSNPTIVPVNILWNGDIDIVANGPSGLTFAGLTGETYQSQATMIDGGHDVTTDCDWISDDEAIATVGLNTGLISFVSVGSASITATYLNGSTCTKSCIVTVS